MTINTLPRRIDGTGKHLYDVELLLGDNSRRTVEVVANNRDQAARIAAKQLGLRVASVNFIG